MFLVSSIDIDKFIASPCSCAGSRFIDKDHGHILKGDLHIIKSNFLRKLICKRPKYRESKTVDFTLAKDNILDGTDKCIISWGNKRPTFKAIKEASKDLHDSYIITPTDLRQMAICNLFSKDFMYSLFLEKLE